MLNMEHVMQFIATADCNSITRAASQLMVSHPTISRNVHSLEMHLGVKLLQRTSTGTKLTEAGHIFYNAATELASQIQALEEKMRGLSLGHSGRLNIVIFCSMTEKVLQVCRQFLTRYKQVDTTIRSDYVFRTSLLDNGTADLLYMFEAPDLNLTDYGTMPVSLDRYCLLISSVHPVAAQTQITMEEIGMLDIPTLWYPHTLEMLGLPIPPSTVDISRLYHNVKSYQEELFDIRMGKIAAIVPSSLALDAGSDCRALSIPDTDQAGICRRILVIWRKDNPNPCLHAFLEVLRQEVPPLDLEGWRPTC